MSYVIVTDTALDIEEEFLLQNGICTVPFSFTLDEYDTVEDDFGKTVSYSVVYQQLEKGNQVVSSQPSDLSLASVFEGVLKSNRDVVYIGTSAALNESFHAACRVRDTLNKKYWNHQVYCADSRSAAGGQALLLREAVERKNEGMPAEHLVDWVKEFSSHICHWFVTPPSAQRKLIMYENVSFIPHEGKLTKYKKIRNRKKALEFLVKQFYEDVREVGQYPVIVSHSGCPTDAEFLAQQLLADSKSQLKQVECYFMTPSMAAHTGAGAVGLFFYGERQTK